jgi:hypothetical protein
MHPHNQCIPLKQSMVSCDDQHRSFAFHNVQLSHNDRSHALHNSRLHKKVST